MMMINDDNGGDNNGDDDDDDGGDDDDDGNDDDFDNNDNKADDCGDDSNDLWCNTIVDSTNPLNQHGEWSGRYRNKWVTVSGPASLFDQPHGMPRFQTIIGNSSAKFPLADNRRR